MYNENKKKLASEKHSVKIDSIINSIILFYLKQNTVKKKQSLKDFVDDFEKKIIFTALDVTNGNQKIAAEILGVKKTTLNEKIKRFGVCRNKFNLNITNILDAKLDLVEYAI